jgi:hypothetical protein
MEIAIFVHHSASVMTVHRAVASTVMIVHVVMMTEKVVHRVVASVVMTVRVISMKTVLAVKTLAPQHSVVLMK